MALESGLPGIKSQLCYIVEVSWDLLLNLPKPVLICKMEIIPCGDQMKSVCKAPEGE